MSAQWSPEWLSETATSNLLRANTAIANIYISDTLEKRQWPCLIVTCNSSEEMKLGKRPQAIGGYQSGVFQQSVEIVLEIKADLLVKPSQNAQITPEASKLWMQVYQALHQNVLLQTILTNAVAQPYECFSATLEEGSQSFDEEKRVWRKSIILQLRAMASTG